MVEILFSPEKVPQNVSKNKLALKNAVIIGLVWELLAPGYEILVTWHKSFP